MGLINRSIKADLCLKFAKEKVFGAASTQFR